MGKPAGEVLSVRSMTSVLAVALVLRLLWAAAVRVVPTSDSQAYDRFAQTLVEHGVFGWDAQSPFAFWPPGTSFVYAGLYKIFGVHHEAIVGLNVLLSVVIIVCTARVADRWFGRRAAMGAAWILAVWPTLVLFTTVLASELLYVALTMAALDAWTVRGRSVRSRAVVAGLLLGYAALVRSQALALPIVYGVGVWLWQRREAGLLADQVRMALLSMLVMAAVVAPWIYRNYRLYDAPVIVSTNGGITLWMGNSPGSKGDFASIPQKLRSLNDYQQSQVLGAEAKAYILSDPAGFVVRTAKKLVYLFANESIGVTWNAQGIQAAFGESSVLWLKRMTQLSWALIVVLSCGGLWEIGRRDGWRAMVLSPVPITIGFYAVVHSVMVSQDRYHLAFAGQIAMLCGYALAVWPLRRRAPLAAAAAKR